MAGTFILGETKVRPGTYFNIQKKGGNAAAGVMNGVTAVIFRADFGPLNEAIELSAEDGYEGTFGTALTTDAMKEAIAGGAKTIIACRVGNGGTQGSIKLQDSDSTDAVSITAKYPGAKDFVVTVREKLQTALSKSAFFMPVQQSLRRWSLPPEQTKLMPLWMRWHLPRISRQRLSSPAP